jgi:hypothetical protein
MSPPRKSVLFFARVGDQRVRCYVQQDALIEPAHTLGEDVDVYQRCRLAFLEAEALLAALDSAR